VRKIKGRESEGKRSDAEGGKTGKRKEEKGEKERRAR